MSSINSLTVWMYSTYSKWYFYYLEWSDWKLFVELFALNVCPCFDMLCCHCEDKKMRNLWGFCIFRQWEQIKDKEEKMKIGGFKKINLCIAVGFHVRKTGFFDCCTFISVMFRTPVMIYYSLWVTQVRQRQTLLPWTVAQCKANSKWESFMEEGMSNSSFSSVSVTVFILLDISQSKLYFRLVALGSRLEKDEILVWYATQAWGKAKNMCEKLKWQGHVDSLVVGAATVVCCIMIRDGPASMNEMRAGLDLHPLL